MTLPPRRRPLRIQGFDYADPNQVYFVTVNALRGTVPFLNADWCAAVVQSLYQLRDSSGVHLFCYCLMPNHLHLLLSVSARSGDLMEVLRAFKSYTTKVSWSYGWSGALWARSFYERVIRGEEECRKTCEYILANPVRAALVEDVAEYKYSAVVDQLPL